MPGGSEIERRDRALIAFTILSGARDGAIASLKLRHIDVVEGSVDVQTKFSKSFVTAFFPVADDVRAVVVDWIVYLPREGLRGLEDPLFPATKVALCDNLCFGAIGLERKHWTRADPIRVIFKGRSRRQVCVILIRIALGRLWRYSAKRFARRRRNIRLGRRTWGTSTC
jgi:integrase